MNVLDKIVLDKRDEVELRKLSRPLTGFINELCRSDRDFKQALWDDFDNKGAAYILECKKASPSKGLIRPHFDLDEICNAYKEHASCVSVLTDEKYFQGEFERLPLVRERLHQPVLCKDFFIDEYQVYLARAFGANAILLMLSVLDDEQYNALAKVAKSLDMAILTEVSNEQEMQRAVSLKADILGINNRNLRDLSTDLNKTPELVSLFNQIASDEQQKQTILISESGIYHHQQVKLLLNHVKGFLVGSSLMSQDNLADACTDLIEGEHKVCGLSTLESINSAISSGAKYQGLIFVNSSPRAISIDEAKSLTQQANQANFVAVVRNMPLRELQTLVCELPLAAVQLHGDEDQDYIDQLKNDIKSQNLVTQVWKAVPVSNKLPASWPKVDRIVLDTKAPSGESGGTGLIFDWQVLSEIDLSSPPILLAGGINEDNAKQAFNNTVIGLDINSGVETAPGVKSIEKIKTLFSILKN